MLLTLVFHTKSYPSLEDNEIKRHRKIGAVIVFESDNAIAFSDHPNTYVQ